MSASRLRRASSRLAGQAVRQMDTLSWFGTLSASQRADVGLVVQAGIGAFVAWLAEDGTSAAVSAEVFNVAPRELARVVSLKQTVQLIRVVVGVMETEAPRLAPPGGEQEVLEAVLRYSREVAFAAAEVYAATAEARGAWDARVEAGVVEALVQDRVGDLTLSRATSLGWRRPEWVTALAATTPGGEVELHLEDLRVHARHSGLSVLTGEGGGGLIVVVGGSGSVDSAVQQLAAALPDGPVVVGPVVADLLEAASCVAEALAGLAAVTAWPAAPRPVWSRDLLAERAVLGDPSARLRLLEEVHGPLAAAGGDLLVTVSAFLDTGGSIEATARVMFVHANTVRYRLRKVAELLGHDVAEPRGAQVVWLALVLARAEGL